MGKILADLSGLDRLFQLKLARPGQPQIFSFFSFFGPGPILFDPVFEPCLR
jgi:hypothetical protein